MRAWQLLLAILLALAGAVDAGAKDGFVFLGATGDNALRPSGVWTGLYEAFAGGVFDSETVGIHVAMNTPHTLEELNTKVTATLTPLYEELKQNKGWKCLAKDGDCSPARLLKDVVVNIWEGRDAKDQAKNMSAALSSYRRITVYLSIPPFVFGSWSQAAVEAWGQDRVHVAAEKPFGTSLEDAEKLHGEILDAGVPEGSLHLVDHWLSFFMNRHLPDFRRIVQPRLGIEWGTKDIERIVVTEFETRGLDGRGGFFDGVGQVRDMVQSHLLQVFALAILDPAAEPRAPAKFAIFNRTSVQSCRLSQYDSFLFEPKLSYHAGFADATLCEVHVTLDDDEWKDVEVVITTGKDMGTTLYTVDFYQRSGPGVLTYEIGKEETGVAGIKVRSWPLKDSSEFEAPLPGFGEAVRTKTVSPSVSPEGDGYILQYSDPEMYFPKPYAMMAAALLTGSYGTAFVTYPECKRSWEVVTAVSPALCLNPPPEEVRVYSPPTACGNPPPQVCFKNETVEDLYDKTFACTPEHNKLYANVSLYKAKCKLPSEALII